MKKIETIWHYILDSALEDKKFKHTQKEIAEKFNFSLSTVNHSIETPSRIGAIRKESKFFVLENFQKLLYFWASNRNLEKDIIYKTYVNEAMPELEGLVPANATYACYSAAKKILNDASADYSQLYFYINDTEVDAVKGRFPPTKEKRKNIFVLKSSEFVYGTHSKQVTSLPQTFVDIWNLNDWYSKDFTLALEEKINGILS